MHQLTTILTPMLGEQKNRVVMDFDRDITSGKVLRSAWTLVETQTEQEDRDNGTGNLINHLSNAVGYCSTRHTEETLLALQDSYGSSLKQTAAQAKAGENLEDGGPNDRDGETNGQLKLMLSIESETTAGFTIHEDNEDVSNEVVDTFAPMGSVSGDDSSARTGGGFLWGIAILIAMIYRPK